MEKDIKQIRAEKALSIINACCIKDLNEDCWKAKLFEENEVSMEDILKCDGEESIGRFMIFYAGDFHDICFFNTVEGVTNEFDRAMENSSSSDEVYYIQDVWDLDDTNYSESKTLRNILGFVFNTTVL